VSKPRKIKLLLADDHALVRQGIRSSLVRFGSIRVVGEATNGKDAVKKTLALAPDVVLMDINMPEMSGLEATTIIRKQSPSTQVLALTVHDNQQYVSRMLRDGAAGYVLKDTSPEELVRAIESVAKGEAYFSPPIARILLNELAHAGRLENPPPVNGPSGRERQVLQSIARGNTSKEIATRLNLSVRTVETYRVRLKRKLHARNVAELLQRAREQELL